MATQASVLVTKCLDNLSRAATGTSRSGVAYSTLALTWLNNVQIAMSRLHDFRELYLLSSSVAGTSITVASTKNYTFPTNWKAIIDIRVIDGLNSRKLGMKSPPEFDVVVPYPENETTGVPAFYIPLGNTFDLYPIPDGAYVMPIRYIAFPAAITLGSTEVSYGADKDDILVAGMTAEGFEHLQLFDDASLWRQKFKGLLKDAILLDMYPRDYRRSGVGFDSRYSDILTGEYYNNPLIRYNP